MLHFFTLMDADVCMEARRPLAMESGTEDTVLFLALAFAYSHLCSETTLQF